MAKTLRMLDSNLVKTAGAVLTASSYYQSLPVRHLLDQLRSKVWRSAFGWSFVDGQNYSLDFNRGGVKNAVIAVGTYATGPEVASALQAALEAADPTPVWSVTYSTTTFKFTISSDLPFTILSGTGAALGESLLKDLGFATGSDTGSATSHTAGEASYQSRHAIDMELPAEAAITAMYLLDHNVSASGLVKFVASDFALVGNGLDDSPVGGFELSNMAGNTELRIHYASIGSFQYFRFILDDVQSSVGYGEVGIAFAGTYRQLTQAYSDELEEPGADLSVVELATEGALFGVQRPEAPAWQIRWRNLQEADADALRTHRTAVPHGMCFGLAFDAGVDNLDFAYGHRDSDLPISTSGSGGSLWQAGMLFREALP